MRPSRPILALIPALALVAGCGGTVPEVDTAETIPDPAVKPAPAPTPATPPPAPAPAEPTPAKPAG